jgi:hypothetical protein
VLTVSEGAEDGVVNELMPPLLLPALFEAWISK